MKKLNTICFTLSMVLLALCTSCADDFLDRPPLDVPVDANFYKTDAQVLAGSSLLYNKVWFEYNRKASFSVGDFRGGVATSMYGSNWYDNTRFFSSANTETNYSTWIAFYNIIGQCNTFIVNVDKYAGAAVNPTLIKQTIAEAKFMRASAYSMLTMNYGAVPIITNNFTLVGDTTQVRHTPESVWKFITKDLRAAAADLPGVGLQKGRVSKWAAEGMLARTYLTRAGIGKTQGTRNQVFLDSTKYYSERVITQSGAKLQDKYGDLFLTKNENNPESLFALQWVFANSYSETTNSTISQLSHTPSITNGIGYGGDVCATLWMLSKYEGFNPSGTTLNERSGRTLDQRLRASFMMPGTLYPEITQVLASGVEAPYTVEYKAGDNVSYAWIKKYVVGQAKDNDGLAGSSGYEINTYMLRSAEMYLLYAEAALGNQTSTADTKALEYFNTVHTRAGLTAFAGPLTFDKIFDERIVEFAMEGLAWYDIVRLHYYNPQKAYDILSNQDRERYYIQPDRVPSPTSWTFKITPYATSRSYAVNAGNFLLPIPANELSQAPNLRKTPVDYYAGK